MSQQSGTYIQFGCGLCAPISWENYDASPKLRFQQLPIIGRYAPPGPFGRFPSNVQFGDIVRRLPVADNSTDLLYCSHVLEHLSLEDFQKALGNCYRILKPNGVFRLVLPDLAYFARRYIESNDANAVHVFMRETYLGKSTRPRTLTKFLREWLGGSQHLWMWDYKAMEAELSSIGFLDIRRAEFGDSRFVAFKAVEDPERWHNALGIECRK